MRSKPSSTNYPIGFLAMIFISSPERVKPYRSAADTEMHRRWGQGSVLEISDDHRALGAKVLNKNLGGYSSEVPPLPIPNREVKLTHADGTAIRSWESR